MKKSILLSICLLASSIAFAQNYIPMAQENAHWIMFAIGENGTAHHVISLKGDSTINGLVYKKMQWRKIHSNVTSAQAFQPPFYYDASAKLMGALRDDTLAQQVFYIPFSPLHTENDTCDLFDEWLIYDFSISVGDTIGGCLNYYPTFPFLVDSIATQLHWGKDRRVVYSDSGARLIEGVGTGLGPLWNIYAFPHPAKPTFLYDYCVGEEGYCGLELVNSARQQLANLNLRLSPNPVADILTIEWPDGLQDDLRLAIFDFSGKKLLQQSLANSGKPFSLNIGHLANGLYLLIVCNEKDIVAYRFAKQ